VVMPRRFPQSKLVRVESLRVTPDQAVSLTWAARAMGVTKSELIRRAVLEYLDQVAAQ
jgi:hypothetical protein